jgi:glucosamine kinase
MSQSFFIGVDGGASKCTVRLEDESGRVLGRESSGPANIRLSVQQTWQSIYAALEKILKPLAMKLEDKKYRWQVGMGLAGCEVTAAYQAFLEQPHCFETLVISSDAHTACLGAHAGKDGAIIIIGTGAVGFQVECGETTKVGGWGFPHDDEGGGAWLGLQAVKATLQALDGRSAVSELSKQVYAKFENDLDRFVAWANQANSTAFAELAPLVIQHSQAGDVFAQAIMQEAAHAIHRLSQALDEAQLGAQVNAQVDAQVDAQANIEIDAQVDMQVAVLADAQSPLPYALIGGIAPFIQPYLNETLRSRILPCELTPDAGAVLLVRGYLANLKDAYVAQGK